jgi:DNA-binding PadR family transcriptional regulator
MATPSSTGSASYRATGSASRRARSTRPLHRLENKGFLKSEWAATETGREAKFYRLTAKGKRQLDADIAGWSELSKAIALILGNLAPER